MKRAYEILRDRYDSIPSVVQHGDFWPGNILLGRAGTIAGVVDWEGCLLEGLPGCDCMRLLRTAAMGKALAVRLLDKYCEILNHPAITPDVCRALAVLDVLRTRRIVERQACGRVILDEERSLEAILEGMR